MEEESIEEEEEEEVRGLGKGLGGGWEEVGRGLGGGWLAGLGWLGWLAGGALFLKM